MDISIILRGIKKAISLPDHPPILEKILAFAYERNGQLRASLLQWKKVLLSTTDRRTEKICQNNIRRIMGILIERDGREKALLWMREKMLEEYRTLVEVE